MSVSGKSSDLVITSLVKSQDYSGGEGCGYYKKLRAAAVPTSFLFY